MKLFGFGIDDVPQIGYEAPITHTQSTNTKSETSGWFFKIKNSLTFIYILF